MARTRTGVQKCSLNLRTAQLSGEFGQETAQRWFQKDRAALETQFGTYSRGPRKGLPKGTLWWVKVEEGGWHYGLQCVLKPGMLFAALLTKEEATLWQARSMEEIIRSMTRIR